MCYFVFEFGRQEKVVGGEDFKLFSFFVVDSLQAGQKLRCCDAGAGERHTGSMVMYGSFSPGW